MSEARQPTFLIRTLGCKANLVDSQLLETDLRRKGWIPAAADSAPDLCIINSCTVTDEADKQSLKTAERLVRDHPKTKVVMTGCGAEVHPERWLKSGAIHAVVGNQDKRQLAKFANELNDRGQVLGGVRSYVELRSQHPMDREWAVPEVIAALPDQSHDRTRAFLKVQEGCNAFCTYCIIPYGRGPSRSLSPDVVIRHVLTLQERGIREVVITGTNIGDYGTNELPGMALARLVERLLRETREVRFRLSSLDPTEICEPLFEMMESENRLCPHFHVSLQSPLSATLRRMKRKYDTEQSARTLRRIAGLRIAHVPFVGMDVITGFPGETEEDFAESTRLLQDWPWARLHVFPYSERSGTPATRLGGKLDRSRRVERARQWMQLSTERLEKFTLDSVRRHSGRVDGVILEAPRRNGSIQGYSANYMRVEFAHIPEGMGQNDVVSALVLGHRVDRATGDVILHATVDSSAQLL